MLKKPSKKPSNLFNLKSYVKNGWPPYRVDFRLIQVLVVRTIMGIMLVTLPLPVLSQGAEKTGYDRWLEYKNNLCADKRLVVYYTFENEKGEGALENKAVSDTHNVKYGEVVGATWFRGGRWIEKNTLSFDGIDDYVNCRNPADFDFGANDFTIEAWIKAASNEYRVNNYPVIFSKGTPAGHGYLFGINGSSGVLQFQAETSDGWSGGVGRDRCDNGEWHYVAVTKSGASLKFYLDGSLDAEGTMNAADIINSADYNAMIGNAANWWFIGTIDELAIYNSVLTVKEIEAHYKIGYPN